MIIEVEGQVLSHPPPQIYRLSLSPLSYILDSLSRIFYHKDMKRHFNYLLLPFNFILKQCYEKPPSPHFGTSPIPIN